MSVQSAVPSHRRVRTPERLQMEATECGAASLGIVLAHYGRWVSLEELRDACGISRDGSNARMVKDAAVQFGLQVRARRAEPETLKTMNLPVIVYWRFNHFLVVEGWTPKGWYLNDPAVGHRTCTDEEFDEAFTGIVLEPTPGPDFVRGGAAPKTLRRLADHLTGSRDGVVLMAVIGLALIVPQILVPGLARVFVDALAGQSAISVPAVVGSLVFAAMLQATLIGLQGSVGLRMAMKINVLLSSAMASRLLRLPVQFHALRGASTLAFRAAQPEAVATTAASLFSTVTVAVLSSATAAVVLVVTYPPVGVVAAVALALIIGSQRVVAARQRTLALRIVREQSDVAVITATALGQIEVVKASGAEDALIARWTRAHDRLLAATQEMGERVGVMSLLPGTISTIAGIAVTLTALIGVMNGTLSLGGLVAVQTLNGLVLGSVPLAVSQVQQAQTLTGQLDQIDDVLKTKPDPRLADWGVTSAHDAPIAVQGRLELRSVSFGYLRGGQPLVRDLDLVLTPGKRVALVGPSGCGKSTVSRLVVGWYEPWSGEILVDGRPRSHWPESVLSSYLAVVDQDPVIFSGTIRDNITMWNQTIPEADVIAAATDACLHDDIVRRPGAYEARLSEFGGDLSGGQRQRLEIARALVRNPALIVLDEATSALDAATEAAVDAAIRRRGSAALVIAHRLSTIRDCDEIIVLDRGNVVERGTHADLLDLDGAYARLVRA